ncbi:hypothetical protein [Deinococcus apachensis]|uniref:hypothetical protein n=1 Tax=Deinococcus apachensis TaxID=309886 RepID=UPI000371BFA1|nr:hypothetical protein [Deinococcus apachensis]
MNKYVKVILPLGFVLLPVAAAQQSSRSGQNAPQLTPEMRARMAQMQPIMDLSQTVRLLPDLEKNKATAVTKAQARQLLPILTALQKAKAVQPNDAKKYLTQIEDKILTGKQLTALDDLTLKAEQEREARRAQAQQSGQGGQGGFRIPGVPGGLGAQRAAGTGQNRAGQNGQGQGGPGNFQPGQFNPFAQGRGADALKQYIAVLQKK